MRTKVNTLIVDDHFAIIEGYKSILNYCESYEFKLNSYTSIEETKMHLLNLENKYELILLDLLMPNQSIGDYYPGELMAKEIRITRPTSKIVILTSCTETLVLYSIYKTIKPDALLIKSDFSAQDLIFAIETVMNGKFYYSHTVLNSIQSITNKHLYLDSYNRQIISLLNKGIRTKSLPTYLNLSLSAIDKRKAQIKDYLSIEKGGDEDILREAKKLGLI